MASLPPPAAGQRDQRLTVCALLLLAVGLVFGQTIRHEFVNLDDNKYVYENPLVRGGLRAQKIGEAFTQSHAANWVPLTWLSLMGDYELHGLHAGGYHLTNVLLHAVTTVLLFLVLTQMTGRIWPSALVAALFAVHPLRVESVAWVTERKDVLSGLFFALALGAYVGYVRHRPSLARYAAVMVVFALGLMSKAMLVTLPLVLLLLDYWPLGRWAASPCRRATLRHGKEGALVDRANFLEAVLGRFPSPWHLVIEKLPLLVLVAGSCLVTVCVQGEALAANEFVPLSWRLGNAPISYVTYLSQFLYPASLAVLYPPLGLDVPLWKVLAAVLIVLGITAAALAARRKRPYLLVGWLWFLGMLLPVIGLVRVGLTAVADRFTYLPQIGLCIALAWAAGDVYRSWPHRRGVCGMASALLLAILMGCAWRQTSFWRDSETLWTHTLACTARNSVAHNSFGVVLTNQGRHDEAIVQYQAALEIDPEYQEAYCNLGTALAGRGQYGEAIACYQKALQIQPDFMPAHCNLGRVLAEQGRLDEAILHDEKAVEIQPDNAEAHATLANHLGSRGRFAEAAAQYQRVLEIVPDDADAHYGLGAALRAEGQMDEALGQFERALELQPDHAEAHFNVGVALGDRGQFQQAIMHCRQALAIKPEKVGFLRALAWLLATCPEASLRNGPEAIALAQRADQLCGSRRPDMLDALAAAYAEAGRFPEALATARKALALARQQQDQAVANALRSRIALYESGRPYRQMPRTPVRLPPKP